MSLETWKREFYPVLAMDVKGKLKAIKHSLQKWTGLLQENLDKHDCSVTCCELCDNLGDMLWIDSDSCALCNLYDNKDNKDNRCKNCPLYRDGKFCDSEYREFVRNNNPTPMIKLLQKALKEGE